ncbi:restriction endonuclease [Halobaculum limi]|uniref:restriction endonuclease n=1 Tax=Halobaculum limi TaxID=3031916 RepID=UPI0024054153|nr:restriction endonuclease [Halobaculum sp. YSMS11]
MAGDETESGGEDVWTDVDSDVYEEIVGGIEESEGVERVENKYDLSLNHGGSKEVDVAVWTNANHHHIFIIIECKFWQNRVPQSVIAETISNVANSTADKGVVVAKSGFQSGAIEQAEGAGVDLYTLREIEDGDLEGRIQTVNTRVEFKSPEFEIEDTGVSPVDSDLSDDEIREDVEQSGHLTLDELDVYDRDRTPTGETVQDLARKLSTGKQSGKYTDNFDDKLIVLNHTFYSLDYLEYIVRSDSERTSSFNGSRDVNDLYDLVRINTIREQELALGDIAEDGTHDPIEFVSIDDALAAFTGQTDEEEDEH